MQAKKILLQDYQIYPYEIERVNLFFDIFNDHVLVSSEIKFSLKPGLVAQALVLNGEDLEIQSINLNACELKPNEYSYADQLLNIPLPLNASEKQGLLKTVVKIYPAKNTSLSGLYASGKILCTQCEAEGFRRITFFPDRPDVLTQFTTSIKADKTLFPVLLSNGNLAARGEDQNKQIITWVDPHKKPSYLFALVAGPLVALEDYYVTKSQRLVTLKLYLEPENWDRGSFSLECLKKAMVWDEKTYDREYDLDVYHIVAVNDFNMGAMENKGLNIFNAKYALVNPKTATDLDYENVDAVIAHEYFHNWSGNRVTCRDWFQLSLKEGLTVFREQHYMAEQTPSGVALLDNVSLLRTRQFAEDNGPMAHPVQPDSYLEINNFYTMTIYEKGSEIIRMLKTLLGWPLFKKAMNEYFSRFDGQAVTINDFVENMSAVAEKNLTQFMLWYKVPGTPCIYWEENYDAAQKKYSLKLKQEHQKALHIPIKIGLLDSESGKEILGDHVLELKDFEQTFVFENLANRPVLSLLRDFSAPVYLKTERSLEELLFLLEYDQNLFCQWEAAQNIWRRMWEDNLNKQANIPIEKINQIIAKILENYSIEADCKASLLSLPSLIELLEIQASADPEQAFLARNALKKALGLGNENLWLKHYQAILAQHKSYAYNPKAVAERSLQGLCLSFLIATGKETYIEMAYQQFLNFNYMHARYSALSILCQTEHPLRQKALDAFYEEFKADALVLNKWLGVQASSEIISSFDAVQALEKHSAFSERTPNKVYALILGFAMNNPRGFHGRYQETYPWLSAWILRLNALNPQVASRATEPFTRWNKLAPHLKKSMHAELEKLATHKDLSSDVYEQITRALKGA
ncbi:MAG: aminopeptidase N [Gammaproteobacteria bacterium]